MSYNRNDNINNFFVLHLCYRWYYSILFDLPTDLTVTLTPSGPIQEAMVGSPLMIQCTVSTVNGVESSSVMISWMGPGGDTITSDSRVTISGTTGLMSTLNFMYLMEGDEGTYTCNVMSLNGGSGLGIVEIIPTGD